MTAPSPADRRSAETIRRCPVHFDTNLPRPMFAIASRSRYSTRLISHRTRPASDARPRPHPAEQEEERQGLLAEPASQLALGEFRDQPDRPAAVRLHRHTDDTRRLFPGVAAN